MTPLVTVGVDAGLKTASVASSDASNGLWKPRRSSLFTVTFGMNVPWSSPSTSVGCSLSTNGAVHVRPRSPDADNRMRAFSLPSSLTCSRGEALGEGYQQLRRPANADSPAEQRSASPALLRSATSCNSTRNCWGTRDEGLLCLTKRLRRRKIARNLPARIVMAPQRP
jgi:hypothetical protein